MFLKQIKSLNVGQRYISGCNNKIFQGAKEALFDVKDGDTLGMGGFGIVGIPEHCVQALVEKKSKRLNIVSNLAGTQDWGIGLLLQKHQVRKMNASYVGENPLYEKQYLKGEVEMNLIPQGSLAEKLRCGSAGIAAFYTPTGVATLVEKGGFPAKLGKDGKSIEKLSRPKEKTQFGQRFYLLEEALHVDFALVKAYQADKKGNLRFRKTARNFNPDLAGAGKVTIAEVEQIVDEIPPEQVHFPGCFVDRVFEGTNFQKKIERLRIDKGEGINFGKMDKERMEKRLRIINRAAKELKDGMYCNLGIGIPSLASNAVKADLDLQSENGLVGLGPYPKENEVDHDLINAGKETVTANLGSSFGRSSETFGMMRGGHLHMTMLGGLQVSTEGDLANWIIPGKIVKGMGGAMDLVASGAKVVVTMEHTSSGGVHKILEQCSLPLTGKSVLTRVITDMAVFDFTSDGMMLVEIAPGLTVEAVKANTSAKFKVAKEVKVM